MTERERLIKLMRQAYEKNINLLDFEKDILADYLLENGVIVPPCKVRQTVFLTKEEAEQALKGGGEE